MFLKSILLSETSVTLAVAPDAEGTAPSRSARAQLFVLSLYEWNRLNRALGYDPAAGLTLSEGIPLDERMFGLLEEAAERTAALRYAARLLAAADSSEAALRRKLREKDFSPASVDDAVRRLRAKGYLDDRAAAARYAESLLTVKRYGRRRVYDMLMARGFDRECARDAADALDPAALAAALDQLVRRRAPGLLSDDPLARKKAVAVLMRLGYSSDEIREAARRARGT